MHVLHVDIEYMHEKVILISKLILVRIFMRFCVL